jgi:integrase
MKASNAVAFSARSPLAFLDRLEQLEKGEGYRPWAEWEIEQFRAAHGTDKWQRVAFEMLLNTGQRSGDVVRMVRQQYSDGKISVTQEKTKARMWISVSNDLRTVLDPWLAAAPLDQLSIIVGDRGAPLTSGFFSRGLLKARRDAGLGLGADGNDEEDRLVAHGLRHTATTRLHELGLSFEAIGSITGHKSKKMVEHYVQQNRDATAAISMLNKATATK